MRIKDFHNEMIHMFNEGFSYVDIGKKIKYDQTSIRKYLNKIGYKRRSTVNNFKTIDYLDPAVKLKKEATRKQTKIFHEKIDYILETQNETLRVMRLLYNLLENKKRVFQKIQ
jgi:uncharacterized protein Smg (DUF494 family)